MWNMSSLMVAAMLVGSLEAPADARIVGFPGTSESFDAASDGAKRLARKRVRSKKKSRIKARRSRSYKPTPKPTPRPAPKPVPAQAPQTTELPVPVGSSLGRTTRIEFDAQLIKGQTTKAGEVQILERKDVALKSMVKRRTSFREEIIHTVFPEK